MPKLDAKQVQKELEQGQLWPVYWIYGPERLKGLELARRIQKQVLGPEAEQPQSMNRIRLDGATATIEDVIQEASSFGLFGGSRVIWVEQAHLLKEVERLEPIFGERATQEQVTSVVILMSKDLDGRKKSSKLLVDRAAVVACDAVAESEREPWIQYLAQRLGLSWAQAPELAPEWSAIVERLRLIDPWSLELIEGELKKLALIDPHAGPGVERVNPLDLLSGQASNESQSLVEAFLKKDRTRALACVASFSDRPEEVFPLLGLLAWNVRHLAILLKDRESRTRSLKLSPFLMERLDRTAQVWKLKEALLVQERLFEMDYSFKQTQRIPLGVWTDFILTCLA